MNRKQFIESHGASCNNWFWSWSFINKAEKFVIFGAWNIHTTGNTSLILSEKWKIDSKGNKAKGYKQSREHIRLIEEEGYQLKTFPMTFSDENRDDEGVGPAKIKGFIPELANKSLKKVGGDWYASDNLMSDAIAEEIVNPEEFYEGASKTIKVNVYERNSDARKKCIEHYGYKCAVCSFDFENVYGSIGENYIHVHHKIPISEIKKEYKLDPINDLIPVCPNCHSMIHRTTPSLTVEELKKHLEENQINND